METVSLFSISVPLGNTSGNVYSKPTINGANFAEIMAYYDAYAANYNDTARQMRASGHNAQTLKSTHRALFADIVTQIKGQLNYFLASFADAPYLTEINDSKPFVLFTNNVRIGERTGKDKATIWRNLNRLTEAGVIVRQVSHGTRHDYELHINPDFLRFTDMAVSTQTLASRATLVAECRPIDNNKNNFKNTIMPVDNSDRNTAREQNATGTFTGTERCSATGKASQVQESRAAAPKLSTMEQNRRIYACWLVDYMLKILFPNHKHYPAAIENARIYAQKYFDGCATQAQFAARQRHLQWRVDAAARYIQRKRFDFSNIYITDYLDTDNHRCGFTVTKQWAEKAMSYEKMHTQATENRRHKTDLQKLQAELRKLHQRYLQPDFSVKDYIIAESYVTRNIPELHQLFYDETAYIRRGDRNCKIA